MQEQTKGIPRRFGTTSYRTVELNATLGQHRSGRRCGVVTDKKMCNCKSTKYGFAASLDQATQ